MTERILPLDSISSSPNRPYGGDGDIKILAEDIRHNGLINSITVKAVPDGEKTKTAKDGMPVRFEVVAGRRRVAAAKLLGWTEIPARILEGGEAGLAEEISLSENVNRMAMHPLDEAVYFKRLMEGGEPIQKIAARYDRKAAEIYQRVRLLSLEPAVRELFRAGRLPLAGAAMLADLDAEKQALFAEQQADSYEHEIEIWEIARFITGIYHDKLYACIADKKCARCKKRTLYTDGGLFPEIDVASDSCLDHACYLEKWRGALGKAVTAAAKENPESGGARILVIYNNDIKKILGDMFTLGRDDYQVKLYNWNNIADKPGEGTLPALEIKGTETGDLGIEPTYWREKPGKSKADTSGFKPVMELLGLSKEEQKEFREAVKSKKLGEYDFNSRLRGRVFWRLMEAKAALPAEGYSHEDIVFFLKEFALKGRYGSDMGKDEKRVFKLFTGYEYDGDVDKLLPAGWAKICALITALHMDEYRTVPDIESFESGKDKERLGWFPVSDGEIRKIYQEEARALLPKPKPAKAAKKTPKGKKPE
jgi:ParB/RepB/Spo0J family partition protein